MLESFAATQTLLTISVLVAIGLAIMHGWRWRSLKAKELYLAQCDVALRFPRFSNPDLMKLDLRDKTANGDAETFECYEWFVARLVYVLDEAMRLVPSANWYAVAATQLGNHKHYFASDYYAKQNYLPHYSGRMRKMIQQQRKA